MKAGGKWLHWSDVFNIQDELYNSSALFLKRPFVFRLMFKVLMKTWFLQSQSWTWTMESSSFIHLENFSEKLHFSKLLFTHQIMKMIENTIWVFNHYKQKGEPLVSGCHVGAFSSSRSGVELRFPVSLSVSLRLVSSSFCPPVSRVQTINTKSWMSRYHWNLRSHCSIKFSSPPYKICCFFNLHSSIKWFKIMQYIFHTRRGQKHPHIWGIQNVTWWKRRASAGPPGAGRPPCCW